MCGRGSACVGGSTGTRLGAGPHADPGALTAGALKLRWVTHGTGKHIRWSAKQRNRPPRTAASPWHCCDTKQASCAHVRDGSWKPPSSCQLLAHLGAAALAPGARGFMFSDQPEAGGSVLVVAEAVGTAAAQPKTEAVFGDSRLNNSAARFGATPAVLPALAFSKVGGLPQQLQHMLHLGRSAAHGCCRTEAAMVLQSMARHGTCGQRRESRGIAQRLSRNQGGQIRHKYGDAGGLLPAGITPPRAGGLSVSPAAESVTGVLPPRNPAQKLFLPNGV